MVLYIIYLIQSLAFLLRAGTLLLQLGDVGKRFQADRDESCDSLVSASTSNVDKLQSKVRSFQTFT